jgi:hypothetical protein
MKSCFVVMPLTPEYKELYDAITPEVKMAFGEQSHCHKADEERHPGMVTEKIVESILNADFVIAVTPDPRYANLPNPNVMYELGVAHSFRKPALLIADGKDGLPFDLRAVETIELDFSQFQEEGHRATFLMEMRAALRRALRTPSLLESLDRRRIPRNPLTTQLGGRQIFIEDLPWLMGYCEVLKREREAKTVWEITRDLYWPSEPLYFESIKAAICDGRKHYFLVPNDDGVLRKADAVRRELQGYLPADEIDNHLRFVAIEPEHFLLWPIAIVLYDADYARNRGGIICEPMKSEVGLDTWDIEIRGLFVQYAKSGDLEGFQERLASLQWTERRRESTFDILLDGRVVDSIATAFVRIWNKRIREEAESKTGDEASALLKTWLIRG